MILWKRKAVPVLVMLGALAKQQYARLTGTWKNIVKTVLISLGGKADLATLYEAVAKAAPDRLAQSNTWRDKIRQVLNQNPDLFEPVARGVWKIA